MDLKNIKYGIKKYPYGLMNRTDTGKFLVMHPRLELGTP